MSEPEARTEALRAYGYTRLSQESRTSIDDQKESITDYAADREGLNLVEVLDDGQHQTGYETESRAEYRRLTDLIQSGDVDAVVIRGVERLGRDFDERQMFIIWCRQNGVELHDTERGRIPIEDEYTAGVEGIHAASDHKGKEKEIERARKAVQKRVDDPDCFHGEPPKGLTYDEAKRGLVVDDEQREAFEEAMEVIRFREDGRTYTEIETKTGVNRARISRILNKQADWFKRANRLKNGDT
ncbi:recombinase family protein [Haloarcula brevis]|uniref:recombinase family protein n=1 Tax=Haloarcula brevis TaxID=3111453 RepID=UPI00300F2EA4